MTAAIAVESDYRLRGRSLSAGRPVAAASLGYDHPTGIYLNGHAVGVLGREGPGLMSLQGNLGYARRLNSRLSVDFGVVRSEYMSSFSGGSSAHYTEVYLGLATRRLSSRISLSPDYFSPGVTTIYGEIDGAVGLAPKWRVNGHIGLFAYLNEPPAYARQYRFDWRLRLSRQFGAFEMHAALSGGGPGADYYALKPRGRTALVIGAAHAF